MLDDVASERLAPGAGSVAATAAALAAAVSEPVARLSGEAAADAAEAAESAADLRARLVPPTSCASTWGITGRRAHRRRGGPRRGRGAGTGPGRWAPDPPRAERA
ncbi:MAG: cyclodeaminase/cyclohydrolase family protein [Solirubrobacteraceae bacterium]